MKLKKLLKTVDFDTNLHVFDEEGRHIYSGDAEGAVLFGTPGDDCKVLKVRIRNNVLKIRVKGSEIRK